MIVLKSCCSSHVHCTNTPNNHRGKCMLNTTWHFNSLKAVCIIARARVYFRAIAEKRPLSPIMPLFRHHFAFALHTTRILWCSAFASLSKCFIPCSALNVLTVSAIYHLTTSFRPCSSIRALCTFFQTCANIMVLLVVVVVVCHLVLGLEISAPVQRTL